MELDERRFNKRQNDIDFFVTKFFMNPEQDITKSFKDFKISREKMIQISLELAKYIIEKKMSMGEVLYFIVHQKVNFLRRISELTAEFEKIKIIGDDKDDDFDTSMDDLFSDLGLDGMDNDD